MEGSLSNGSCSASISGLSKGTVTVRITDNNYSHSVGYHNLREDAFAQDSLNFTNPSLAQIKSSSWIEATYTPRITLCEYPSLSVISGEAEIGSMEDTVTTAIGIDKTKYLRVRCYNDWAD